MGKHLVELQFYKKFPRDRPTFSLASGLFFVCLFVFDGNPLAIVNSSLIINGYVLSMYSVPETVQSVKGTIWSPPFLPSVTAPWFHPRTFIHGCRPGRGHPCPRLCVEDLTQRRGEKPLNYCASRGLIFPVYVSWWVRVPAPSFRRLSSLPPEPRGGDSKPSHFPSPCPLGILPVPPRQLLALSVRWVRTKSHSRLANFPLSAL